MDLQSARTIENDADGKMPQTTKSNTVNVLVAKLRREVAELKLQKAYEIRVGFGNDGHRIEDPEEAAQDGRKAKPIVLAGRLVSDGFSVVANSDGDVVYHAVMNAILLAAGKRDIGYYFPDTKGAGWTDAKSGDMIKVVMGIIEQDGWTVNNATVSITAGAPKLKGHIDVMRSNLARALGIDLEADPSRIGIGATTGENLSQAARKEGIHADAIVTLLRTKK